MKLSGFTYVRNGFNYGCPFVQAIQSVLPICDEFVVAVGTSTDGTREAIEAIGSPKIKIIDTAWDMTLRAGGKVFAQQANIALDHCTSTWALHVQADEVIHENSLPLIQQAIQQYNSNSKVDGFILPFLHFWGDYYNIRNSRRVHRYEVRLFKNTGFVRSYKDSQGFRKYQNLEQYNINEDLGKKLHVKKIDAPVYHYNGIRNSKQMAEKNNSFLSYYGQPSHQQEYDLNLVDRVVPFTGSHPAVMKPLIDAYNFKFEHDTSKAQWYKKDKYLQPIEDFLGFKFGEFKNYKLV
jgi:hypothetical protein